MGHLIARRVFAVALIFLCAPVAADAQSGGTIAGVIDDAQSGLPLGTAHIHLIGGALGADSSSDGRFRLTGLAPAVYRLRIERDGYQTTESDDLVVANDATLTVTLTLTATPANRNANIIGHTTSRAADALQRSSTISRTLSTEALAAAGVYRAGDALRQLPGVNNGITGDTASLGDDLNLNIRGIGTLETVATLDGHPIASGAPGGYNFQLSPIVGIRDISVIYGSGGADLLGVNAIGGVVDSRTIDPTRTPQSVFSQGYGTFNRLATTVQTTGTAGRLGYAVAAGVSTLDGPLRNDTFFQPGAAYDQSATDPAVHALGVYTDDSRTTTRSAVVKLRYAVGNETALTFTTDGSSYWEDKTGNGDGDYYAPDYALARGNQLLTNKSAHDTCPSGTFTATNANNVANGTGPSGQPDGGLRCQTPAQWATFNDGFHGAGPAWQSFNFNDYHLNLTTTAAGKFVTQLDGYSNRYLNTGDRTFALPFLAAPGDSPGASWTNRNITTTGGTLGETLQGRQNDLGIGATYLNVAYSLERDAVLTGAPIVHETGVFLRDVYRVPAFPLTVFANAALKHSTVTRTSYADPRLSLVYAATPNDVVRAAAGATTAQPTGDEITSTFAAGSLPGGAGGGTAISCSSPNAIGTAPASLLQPERGVDEEVAYGHRFGGDTNVQLTVFNENVFNKIYKTTIPLSQSGSGFITPAFLLAAQNRISGACGGTVDPKTLLGVTGNVNVGQLRARGYAVDGRYRIARSLFIDYDYALTSTVIVSVPVIYLKQNLTLIPGAQLPRLPLQTFDGSLDATIRGFELRYTAHTVSAGNTKSLPAYNYSDLSVARTFLGATINLTVSNLFNQYGDIRGLVGDGVPLALNQYATAANYAPLVGTAATEQFGLPNRSLFINVSLRTR